MKQEAVTPNQPLAGITVVEIGHSLSAPYATHILRNLGAEVIKIESEGAGDHARGWGKVRAGDAAVMFHAINCGKKSVAVDLRDNDARAAVRKLILERADVVVQNMKPGAVEKAGLDATSLRADKPQLIYCNIGAFGNAGPLRNAPGYDPLAQAMSGMMSLIGSEGDKTSRIPISINDIGSGMWAAIGILSAIHHRDRSNDGMVIDTSLYETAFSWMIAQVTDYLNSGEPAVRQGSANANIVPYQVFETADGEMLIAAGNDRLFARLAEVVGRTDLSSNPAYLTGADRVMNRDALIDELEPAIRAFPTDALRARLDAAGVPCGPILQVHEAVDSEQTQALGLVVSTPGDDVRMIGIPLMINSVRVPVAGRSPMLGEHSNLLKD